MFVFGNVLIGVAQVLSGILWIYQWILIARAVTSWVNADPRNAIVRFLYLVTEPPRYAIWRLLPRNLKYFPLDIAFLVLFGLVIFANYGVVQSLLDYGVYLRRQLG